VKRRALWGAGIVAALAGLAAGGGWLALRTEWFREALRRRVETEIHKATGGTVAIKRLEFDPDRWRARLDGLTIRGTEPAGEQPLFHAQAIEVTLKVVSLLKQDVDLAGLRVVRPEIRITVAPDGATNLPALEGRRRAGRLFTEDLLDLAVGQIEIEGGTLWWNDRRWALETAARDLRARVEYDRAGRYLGRIEAGQCRLASPAGLPQIESLALKFQMAKDRIEIEEAVVNTPGSNGRLSGAVENLSDPRVSLRYAVSVDGQEAAEAIGLAELRGGQMEIEGAAEWNSKGWTARGKLAAREVAAAGKEFRLSGVSAAGEYAADPKRLRVDGLTVRLLGGQWTGILEAVYEDGKRARLDGRMEGIRLEQVTAALETASRPLGRLGWTAALAGPVKIEVGWPVTAAGVSVEGAVGLAGEVSGVVRGAYRGRTGEVELAEARLSTAATSVAAAGRLGGKDGAEIRFEARTSRIEEPATAALAITGVRPEIPFRLEGSAWARGRLAGQLQAPDVDAVVEVTDFVHEGRRWDSLTGRLEWSPRRARLSGGRVVRGKAAVSLNAVTQLEDGKFTDRSRIDLRAGVRDTPLEDLAALAGWKAPATGAVTGQFHLEGTRKNPRGAGTVDLRRGTAWGERFDSAQGAVALEGSEVRVSGARVRKGKGVVAGSGSFHLERKTFRVDARAENLALAEHQWAAGTKKVTGAASFSFAGTGRLSKDESRLEELRGEGTAGVRDAAVDGRAIGSWTLGIRAEGERVRVEAQSDFLKARIAGAGEVSLRERFPLEGRMEFRNLDLAAALDAAGVSHGQMNGSADGIVRLSGEASRPEAIAVAGTVTRLELGWSEGQGRARTLRGTSPVNWRLAERKLFVEGLQLEGEGSNLRSSGVVDLRPGGAVQGAVSGTLNLSVAGSFLTKVDTAGFATLNVELGGTTAEPSILGKMEVREVSVGSEELPIGLSKGNGVITFSRQRATIREFTAEAGGGPVKLSGDADIGAGRVSYRLRAEGQAVRLRYPPGFSSVLNGTLILAGNNRRSLLEGEVQILRGGTRRSVDLAAILAGLKQPTRTPSSNDWLQGAQLNVGIVSAPDMQLETSLARNLQTDVRLRLRGTALNPSVLGRMDITGGEIEFQGTRYTLNRGDVSFVNPFRIEPVVNLDVETRVSGYDVSITLSGPLQKLNVTYRSDPPLTLNEVITLLAVGRAPTIDPTLAAQQTSQARSLSQIGADTVVGQAISRPVTGRLERFFGVSRLKVDPEVVGPEGSPNARLTLEQRVGNDITFTYTYNLASAQEQIIRVQWAINRQWSLVAVRDQNGLFGVDFLYRKRYR